MCCIYGFVTFKLYISGKGIQFNEHVLVLYAVIYTVID